MTVLQPVVLTAASASDCAHGCASACASDFAPDCAAACASDCAPDCCCRLWVRISGKFIMKGVPVAYAKNCCDLMASNGITARRSFHRIWIAGNKPLVKRAPGHYQRCTTLTEMQDLWRGFGEWGRGCLSSSSGYNKCSSTPRRRIPRYNQDLWRSFHEWGRRCLSSSSGYY